MCGVWACCPSQGKGVQMPKMRVNRDLNAYMNIAHALMRGMGWRICEPLEPADATGSEKPAPNFGSFRLQPWRSRGEAHMVFQRFSVMPFTSSFPLSFSMIGLAPSHSSSVSGGTPVFSTTFLIICFAFDPPDSVFGTTSHMS